MKIKSNFTGRTYKVVGQTVRQLKRLEHGQEVVTHELFFQGIDLNSKMYDREIHLVLARNVHEVS